MSEFEAGVRYYWSKVRQALQKGNVIEAAEWIESAGVEKGTGTAKELKTRVGKLCRGEIIR